MSDFGRKDFSDKAKEHMTPDSTKSTQQEWNETFTGATDKVARGLEPDSNKSTTQSMGDKVGRSTDEHRHGGSGHSVMDKAKHALGMDKH